MLKYRQTTDWNEGETMPVITKISRQKKQASRYNIFLDEQYAFSVDEDVLIRFQLKKGKHVTEPEIANIKHEDVIRKAFHAALRFLSFRMRSEKEIRDYLRKKEWDDLTIEAVLDELRKQHLTDDAEFAKAFVRTSMNMGKKGPIAIKQELMQKGVGETAITAALKAYTKEKQISDAISLGNKFVSQHQYLSERMLKQKAGYALSAKGFPMDVIEKAMEGIGFPKDEAHEWEAIKREGLKAKRRLSKFSGFEYGQRMKQALFRKGFSLDLIERFLDEEDAEETENA
jgi:regulatory protein